MAIERKQKIRKTAFRKVATNWALDGTEINNGINLAGVVKMCHTCGTQLMPYQDSCPSCHK